MRTFENGNLIQALLKFIGLENGDAKNGDWIEDMFESLDKSAGVKDYVEINERFSLNYFKGKYDYNQNTKRWTKSSDSKIIINFPATPASTSNNFSIIISEYSDVQVTIDNRDKIYVPSKVICSVTRDGQEIASCNASVSWETAGFVTIKEASVTCFTAPFTHTVTVHQVKSTEYDIDGTLCDGTDNPPFIVKFKLKLARAIDEDFFADDEIPVNYIHITVTKGDLSFDGSLDVNTLNKYDNATTEQINSVATINILYKGTKIGDLKLRTINRDDYVFINYKDGTADNVEIYYEPFLDELDNILKKYGDGDTVIDYQRTSVQFFSQNYQQLKKTVHALFKTK
ncbi:MAG: hypothetical protein LBG17_07390 [Bacteroidales bacterium]|nr:hypothetical protein [Bacteroidales bacterium]